MGRFTDSYAEVIESLTMNEKELADARTFIREHEECFENQKAAIKVGPTVSFSINSVAEGVTIKCPICKAAANVTDVSCW